MTREEKGMPQRTKVALGCGPTVGGVQKQCAVGPSAAAAGLFAVSKELNCMRGILMGKGGSTEA